VAPEERKFRRAVDEAALRLGRKDPKGCLALLDAAAPLRPVPDPARPDDPPAADADDPDFLRGLCLMAAGDCERGADLLRASMQRRRRAGDRRSPELTITAMRSLYCPGAGAPGSR
jgi:hypothetical protein